MPAEAYPTSKEQAEWFYRRSGTIVKSPFMLNAGWFEAGRKIYDVPNLVAEAAKDFGARGVGYEIDPELIRESRERAVEFFQTGVAPVSPEETLETLAFMEAADLSKARNGAAVKLSELLK